MVVVLEQLTDDRKGGLVATVAGTYRTTRWSPLRPPSLTARCNVYFTVQAFCDLSAAHAARRSWSCRSRGSASSPFSGPNFGSHQERVQSPAGRSRDPRRLSGSALAVFPASAPQLSIASQAALEEHPSGCKLPPGYASLLDRFIQVVGGDPRVRAAWVHGSVAQGDADEVSDLDVIIAVADDDVAAFAAGWRDRLDEVTPTVMARASQGTSASWLAITPACQRFDLWVEPASCGV